MPRILFFDTPDDRIRRWLPPLSRFVPVSGTGFSTARIGLKRSLKSLLGVVGLLLPRRTGLRVLFYHRVNDHPFAALGPVSREISVRSSAFAAQLGLLRRRGFRSLGLSDVQAMLSGRTPMDPKAILITFDDGYADNLEVAAPLLAAHGFSAVIFVVPGLIGRENGEVWANADPPGLGGFLTIDGLARLNERGIEIASHTLTHPLLTTIPPEARRHELAGSRAALRDVTGSAPIALAYPGGDFDAAVQACAAEAGYALAFTTVPGVNPPHAPPLALRRTEVSASDGPFVFALKIAGALDWLAFKEAAWMRRLLRVANRISAPLAGRRA